MQTDIHQKNTQKQNKKSDFQNIKKIMGSSDGDPIFIFAIHPCLTHKSHLSILTLNLNSYSLILWTFHH